MPGLHDLADRIALWQLDLAGADAADFERCLTADERRRAARYGNLQARNSFVLTRGALRRLLAEYLGTDPLSIPLTTGEHGKPRLAGAKESQGLVFSVSHSGQVSLLAFALDTSLGVDTERLRERRGLEALAGHCLSSFELEAWRRNPSQSRLQMFMRYWVCKEAFVKATGRGIALGLNQVVVREDFTGYAQVPAEFGPTDRWRLREWGDGRQRFALAYSGAERRLVAGTFPARSGGGHEFK